MTSEEIKAVPDLEAYATATQILDRAGSWLQEIAYQLAVVNEANAKWEEANRPPTRAEAFAQADAVATALKRR